MIVQSAHVFRHNDLPRQPPTSTCVAFPSSQSILAAVSIVSWESCSISGPSQAGGEPRRRRQLVEKEACPSCLDLDCQRHHRTVSSDDWTTPIPPTAIAGSNACRDFLLRLALVIFFSAPRHPLICYRKRSRTSPSFTLVVLIAAMNMATQAKPETSFRHVRHRLRGRVEKRTARSGACLKLQLGRSETAGKTESRLEANRPTHVAPHARPRLLACASLCTASVP